MFAKKLAATSVLDAEHLGIFSNLYKKSSTLTLLAPSNTLLAKPAISLLIRRVVKAKIDSAQKN